MLALIVAAAAVAYLLTRSTQVTVPQVGSQQFSVARTRLQNAGFLVNRLPQSSAKTSGTVIAESPGGDTRADKGSTVTLTVSVGLGKVSIPSVQGESKARAEASLTRSGLKVTRTLPQASSKFSSGEAVGESRRGQFGPEGQCGHPVHLKRAADGGGARRAR